MNHSKLWKSVGVLTLGTLFAGPLAAQEANAPPESQATVLVELGGDEDRVGLRLTLGLAEVADDCNTFTPMSDPAVYPPGTTQLAYQFQIVPPPEFGFDRLETKVESACASGVYETTRCNSFAIIMGSPVNNQWTAVLSCGGGEPFIPGEYKAEIWLGGAPLSGISFRIE